MKKTICLSESSSSGQVYVQLFFYVYVACSIQLLKSIISNHFLPEYNHSLKLNTECWLFGDDGNNMKQFCFFFAMKRNLSRFWFGWTVFVFVCVVYGKTFSIIFFCSFSLLNILILMSTCGVCVHNTSWGISYSFLRKLKFSVCLKTKKYGKCVCVWLGLVMSYIYLYFFLLWENHILLSDIFHIFFLFVQISLHRAIILYFVRLDHTC